MSDPYATALIERIRLPEVAVPAGDPGEVRRAAGVLSGGAQALAACRWRLGADVQAMADGSWRCGPGSVAYQEAVLGHRDRLALTAQALELAAEAASLLAVALERDQIQARALRAEVAELVREHDALADALRRFALESPALPAGGLLASSVFGSPARRLEEQRLVRWAERLALDASRVAARAAALTEASAAAARQAAAAFDAAESVTRSARRRQEAADQAAREGPAEDGSVASRISGFLDALADDVTEPIDTVAGLVGVHGDLPGHWARLGSGLWAGVTHPGELVGSFVDWTDIQQGDWGHWAGTVAPSAIATVASFGGYGVFRGVQAVEIFNLGHQASKNIRDALDLLERSEWDEMLRANGGVSWSVLVPGGGLAAHEAIEAPFGLQLARKGGHTLARHVGLTVEQLHHRMRRHGLSSASTFTDRATAERLASEVLDRNVARIARWLAGRSTALPFITPMNRPVGLTLVSGSQLVPASVPYLVDPTRIKMVLVRDTERPIGFFVLTSFPTP